MKYKVNVEELLSRIVEVEAENEEEAEEIIKIMKHNGFRTAFIVELKVDATYTTLE